MGVLPIFFNCFVVIACIKRENKIDMVLNYNQQHSYYYMKIIRFLTHYFYGACYEHLTLESIIRFVIVQDFNSLLPWFGDISAQKTRV